ncbi:MAG: cellulose 1,4-beta-cellobiosidase [Actinomycetota bacterium]|nr:cellulose 1,4-beta-cellobiosidase [Actinomycetota bacterium]
MAVISRPRDSLRRSLVGLSGAALLLVVLPVPPARAALPVVPSLRGVPSAQEVDPGARVDNPYAGALGYVDPEWSAKAAEYPQGERIARTSTAIWLDSIDAVVGPIDGGSGDRVAESWPHRLLTLRQHLNKALEQQKAAGGLPLTVQVVLHNLPGRECWISEWHGGMPPERIDRYREDYVDRIAWILSSPEYRSLRVVAVVEPMALPSLVATAADGVVGETCRRMREKGTYVQGIQYALDTLGGIGNVYLYLDLAHHGFIGWPDLLRPTLDLVAQTARGTKRGLAGVTGFTVNVANYGATVEPYFTIDTVVGGASVRRSRWVDWNSFVDESSFARAARAGLIERGFPPSIGMVIDTSRNGWGGPDRPTGPSSSTDLDTFVDESRTDRRISASEGWCNQETAGLGARPTASPSPGIDAYAWIKPPGESDGAPSPELPGGLWDRCAPHYEGRGGPVASGAMPEAPRYGQWFAAHFVRLLENARPDVVGGP